MNPRVITAQPFFNELDLLEIKMRELDDEVDAHLVVESRLTFTGIEKPLHYAENVARFGSLAKKVVHIVVDLPVVVKSPWDREWLQHLAIRAAVEKLAPKICIWGDVDEIPRAGTVKRFEETGAKTAIVDLDRLTYFFDRFDVNDRPTASRIGHYDPHQRPQPWRGMVDIPTLKDAGWHCQYFTFGDTEHLMKKLYATSHAGEDGAHIMREAVAAGKFPGIEGTVHYPTKLLPRFVSQNLARFRPAFFPR